MNNAKTPSNEVRLLRRQLQEALRLADALGDDHGIAALLRRCLIRLPKARAASNGLH